MSDAKFKTMRHIETVRNYLNAVAMNILYRAERHDQSKFQDPEVEAFEVMTPKLRGLVYGSEEYKACLREMKPAIDHHYFHNASHHPEGNPSGIRGMTLLDLVEMIIDWKCAGLRHDTGDLMKSIEINQKRFGFSDEMREIMENTANWVNGLKVYHRADES